MIGTNATATRPQLAPVLLACAQVVEGTVGPMTTAGTTQTAWFSLTGVDSDCSSGADPATANSCGIHIHEGVSCTSNAGGHYFTELVTTDP